MPKRIKPLVLQCQKILDHLARDMHGVSALTFAVTLVPLIGFTGLAVDGGRAYWARSQLISAVDVAALAGARKYRTASDTTVASDAAQNYFDANFNAQTRNVQVVNLLRNGTITAHGVEYTVSSSITLPTLFMQLFGFHSLTMQANAKAVRSDGQIEVVLALDNTGSMAIDSGGGVSRIQALRDASASLIDGLYGTNTDTPNIHIGIIPYTSQVNVGKGIDPSLVQSVPGYTDNTDPGLGWKGCLDADSTNHSITAADGDDPTSAKWATALDTQNNVIPAGSLRPYMQPSFSMKFTKFVPGQPGGPYSASNQCDTGHTVADAASDTPVFSEGAIVGHLPNTGTKFICDTYKDVPAGTLAATAGASGDEIEFYMSYDYGALGSVFFRKDTAIPGGFTGYTSNITGGDPNYSAPTYFQPASGTNQYDAAPVLPYPFSVDATDRSSGTNLVGKTSDNDDSNYNGFFQPTNGTSRKSRLSPNITCPEPVKPLAQYTKTDIQSYLSSKLHAYYPDWGTFSNSALLWAWRMLSPQQTLFGTPATTGYAKAVVLMTDGLMYAPGNDTYYQINHNLSADAIRTPYGFASQQQLAISPDGNNAPQKEALVARFKKICDSLRKANIKVYVVLLNVVPGVTPKDGGIVDATDVKPYQDCASDPANYFNTNNPTALKNAFDTIAGDLNGVRLAK